MRTIAKVLLGAAVATALVVLVRRTVFAPEPPVVRVAVVDRGTVEVLIANTAAGTVRARRRAKLSPGTSGLVTALLVERGQRVAAGTVLLRLDDTTQRAALALAEREFAAGEASWARTCLLEERAARELERKRALARDELLSIDELDRLESVHEIARADCAVAAAQVERARAAVDAARAELVKTELRAPFEAIIAEVDTELGEWVTPSVSLLAAPELVDAIDPGSIYVSAPMDEVEAARLAVGLHARVTLDSHRGETFAGRVVRVAPYVLDLEAQNRTVEVEVELADAGFAARLLPGTSADVELVLEVGEDVLRVPTLALFEEDTVWVLDGRRARRRVVERGRSNWDWTEIVSGLSPGEHVITHFETGEPLDGQIVAAVDDDGR